MEEYMELMKKASGYIWKFFKTYYGINQKDDERWEECVKVADKLIEPYKGTTVEKYAVQYINLMITELERVSKL